MTAINDAKEILVGSFLSRWNDRTRVFLDNELGEPEISFNAPWVKIKVRSKDSFQASMGIPGNRRFTRMGVLRMELSTIADRGSKENDNYAQAFRNLFEGERFGTVSVTNVNHKELGIDGKWYKSVCEAEYQYDEIK